MCVVNGMLTDLFIFAIFRNPELDTSGLTAVCNILRSNTRIQELSLQNSTASIDESAWSSLGDVIRTNSKWQYLYVCGMCVWVCICVRRVCLCVIFFFEIISLRITQVPLSLHGAS